MPRPKIKPDALPAFVIGSPSLGFAARITKALLAFGTKQNDTAPPDKTDNGSLLATAYMWDMIQSWAKKHSDAAWTRLENDSVIADYKSLDVGKHRIGESPKFVCNVSVSQPVSRFDPQALADHFAASKYKIPQAITLLACEQAKVPKTSSRTLTIEERGVV